MTLPEYITVNGTRYTTAKLSGEAQAQARNVLVVDAEITRLQQQLAIAQTARQAYVAALVAAVKAPNEAAVPAKKPRKPRTAKAKADVL